MMIPELVKIEGGNDILLQSSGEIIDRTIEDGVVQTV